MKINISASFDDGSAEDVLLSDLMLKYNIKTTFYWPVFPEYVNEPKGRKSLNTGEMNEIAKHHEVGAHGVYHYLLTRVNHDVVEQEVKTSKVILENRFKKDVTKFAYPRGYSTHSIQKVVSDAGYASARSTVVGSLHKSENPYFEATTVHVGCDRDEYGKMTWFQYALHMLDKAKGMNEAHYHLWGHGYEIARDEANWGRLKFLLSELQKVQND